MCRVCTCFCMGLSMYNVHSIIRGYFLKIKQMTSFIALGSSFLSFSFIYFYCLGTTLLQKTLSKTLFLSTICTNGTKLRVATYNIAVLLFSFPCTSRQLKPCTVFLQNRGINKDKNVVNGV